MQLPATLGKYELLEFLGGGMSHVYRARDTVIDRTVVVKIMTDDSCRDAEAKARFLQEAKLAGGFQHENIVSVFDYGEFDGKPFIVMEYLKGEDLRDGIRNGHLGSMDDRLRIALSIAQALDYVHERAIIHRDIKPENIHIASNGKVKLMDFGIAKTADLSLTRTGMAMGTPYYMSPEQISGSGASHLVDIYAYGLLVFELLTGIRSVRGETMEQVFFQILNQTVDVAAMENAGVPPVVRDLVVRCTAKKPEERPQSFKAIAEELRGILAGDAKSATQPVPKAPVPKAKGQPTPVQVEPAADVVEKIVEKKSKTPIWIGIAAAVVIAAGIGFWMTRPMPPPTVPGMVYIPAGTFLAGQDKKPASLKAFFIDETEVSNAEFCKAMVCSVEPGQENLPKVGITVAEARAYAKQVGKRLPTSLEWERALRGTQGALFPWGDQKDPAKANVSDNPAATHELMPVRSFSGPLFNVIGNAWEMVEGPVTPSATAIAMFATVMTPPATAQEPWIGMRGGSYDRALEAGFAYDAVSIPERFSARNVGFRCAKD
jgi:formylglycine-generating enzyme required for sulfatase activity/tRNA A-37 threonylcarbamoyl transferase component Bud32